MYTCTQQFTANSRKSYFYGQKIDSYEYGKLSLTEQTRFKKEEEPKPDNTAYNYMMGDMLGTGIPGGLDMDFSTPL